MVGSWLRRRRRQAILAEPFPAEWERWLHAAVRHYRHLTADRQQKLQQIVQVVVAEKHWTGYQCEVTDRMRVVIAANAALLALGLDEPYYYDRLDTVVVHATAIVRSAEQSASNPWLGPPGVNVGEAWHRGPVVLSWSAIQRESSGRDSAGRALGRNVVLHEFAHHLDGLHGDVDGAPPIDDAQQEARWYAVTEAEFLRLVGNSQRGEATVLDHYGASNRAEFFAVATECFFELPHALAHRHRELYGVLCDFYRQDPCTWLPESAADRAAIRRAARRATRDNSWDDAWDEQSASQLRAEDKTRLKAYRAMSPPDALFTLALDHLDAGRHDDAERIFSQLLDQDPDDSEVLAHRAIARWHLDRLDDALSDCDEALAIDELDVDALWIRGEVLMSREEHDEALREFDIAVSVAPQDANVRYYRGWAHCRIGNWRRAIADLTESIYIDPHRADAFTARGLAYEALGKQAAADADYAKAQLLDPDVANPPP